MRLFRTSVSDNINVTAIFEHLAAHFILRTGGGGGAAQALPTVGELGVGSVGGTRVTPSHVTATSPAQSQSGANFTGSPIPLKAPIAQQAGNNVKAPLTPAGSPPPTPESVELVYDPEAGEDVGGGTSTTKISGRNRPTGKNPNGNKGGMGGGGIKLGLGGYDENGRNKNGGKCRCG